MDTKIVNAASFSGPQIQSIYTSGGQYAGSINTIGGITSQPVAASTTEVAWRVAGSIKDRSGREVWIGESSFPQAKSIPDQVAIGFGMKTLFKDFPGDSGQLKSVSASAFKNY